MRGEHMKFKFNHYFSIFVTNYNVDVNEMGKVLDRHPSRIRHWQNDSVPGKSIAGDVLDYIHNIIVLGDDINLSTLIKMYSETVDQQYLKLLSNQNKEEISKAIIEDLKITIHKKLPYKPLDGRTYLNQIIKLRKLYDEKSYEALLRSSEEMVETTFKHGTEEVFFETFMYYGIGRYRNGLSTSVLEKIEEARVILTYCDKALAFDNNPKLRRTLLFELGNVLGISGTIHLNINDFKGSVDYYEKSYALYDEDDKSTNYIRLIHNIGVTYKGLFATELNVDYANKSLSNFLLIERKFEEDYLIENHINLYLLGLINQLALYSNLCAFIRPMQNLNRTKEVYEKLLDFDAVVNDHNQLVTIYNALTNAYSHTGTLLNNSEFIKQANQYNEKCLELSDPNYEEAYFVYMEQKYDILSYNLMYNCDINHSEVYSEIRKDSKYYDLKERFGRNNLPYLNYLTNYLFWCDDIDMQSEVICEIADELSKISATDQLGFHEFLIWKLISVKVSLYDKRIAGVSCLADEISTLKQLLNDPRITNAKIFYATVQLNLYYLIKLSVSMGDNNYNISDANVHKEAVQLMISKDEYRGINSGIETFYDWKK